MRILISMLVVAVAGCATPHNDVLVFGTNTSFGVDVGVQPETGSAPQITIGYKRQEAVYMPLTINARDSAFACKTWNSEGKRCQEFRQLAGIAEQVMANLKYTSSGEPWTQDSLSTNGGGNDAYSVFASFGGKVRGAGDEASMALAQFFATGLAAQRLSASSQVSSLVSTASAEEQELRRIADLERALGVANVELLERTQALERAGQQISQRNRSSADQIAEFVCVEGSVDQDRVDTLFPADSNQSHKEQFSELVGTGDCTAKGIADRLVDGQWANLTPSIQSRIPEE